DTGSKRCGTDGPPDQTAIPGVTPVRAGSQGSVTHLRRRVPLEVAAKGRFSTCRTGAYSPSAPKILLIGDAGQGHLVWPSAGPTPKGTHEGCPYGPPLG